MAGRRLLDAARLFSAARSIASQHIALRSQQLDAYNKTSTLARAVKSQTDRVTLTAQAAVALARRFGEDVPKYASPTERWSPGDDRIHYTSTTGDTQGTQGPNSHGPASGRPEGLEQDHHYDRDETNSVDQPKPEQEMEVQQEEAAENPLPDGTIPPSKSDIDRPPQPGTVLGEEQQRRRDSAHTLSPQEARVAQRKAEDQIPRIFTADEAGRETVTNKDLNASVFSEPSQDETTAYSSLPRTKVPRATVDTQGSDAHVDDGKINQDVYYSSEGRQQPEQIPNHEAVPEQDEIPAGIITDVFHSPRIAKMLGGQDKKGYGLGLKAASRTPVEHSSLQQGKDQDTFNVRQSGDTIAPLTSDQGPQSSGAVSEHEVRSLAEDIAKDGSAVSSASPESTSNSSPSPATSAYQMRESRVPSSRFGRIWQFAGLGTNMAFGAIGESVSRAFGGAGSGSLLLSPGNLERLVSKLSRMRGAALKLGQMISFQDLKMLPPPIHDVLQRVQDSADYMPASQRDKVLSANLGAGWRDLFSSFNDVPLAAASIGQVHEATLASTGETVAVKVQYPGVATSIDSDLSNLSLLLTASRLLPAGLFLDKTIANARTELGWECNYVREAECCSRFGDLLASDDAFAVPKVVEEASGKQVLTAELMRGTAVTKLASQGKLSQEQRDWIGTQILRLCLREMTEFGFMQTDPNWTNFLYNADTKKLELLDFGASRDYPAEFLKPYLRTLVAASHNDRDLVRQLSVELGYLTGAETAAMTKAHIDSVTILAEPFSRHAPEVYDFKDQTITDRVRSVIPVMMRERLAPPPEETYSLHRKLSGAFLLCARLGSRVPCRQLFEDAIARWEAREGKIR